MKCPLCKNGDMLPGKATLTLERDATTLVLKDLPAEACDQCEYKLFDLETVDRAREMLNDAVRRGVQVEVVSFAKDDPLEKHARLLGKVVGNVLALENSLRLFLLEAQGRDPRRHVEGEDYDNLKKGDHVSVNAFTNYSSLGKLIDKYNRHIESKSMAPAFKVDESVVELRDALAHGRVWWSDPTGDAYLFKFDKHGKHDREVRVAYAAQMNRTWFNKQIDLVLLQGGKVLKAAKQLGMHTFPDA